MADCEGNCCGIEIDQRKIKGEDIWLEDQVLKLKKAIPDSLYMEMREIIKEAQSSTPLSEYLTAIAIQNRFNDVFDEIILDIMFDLEEGEE